MPPRLCTADRCRPPWNQAIATPQRDPSTTMRFQLSQGSLHDDLLLVDPAAPELSRRVPQPPRSQELADESSCLQRSLPVLLKLVCIIDSLKRRQVCNPVQ